MGRSQSQAVRKTLALPHLSPNAFTISEHAAPFPITSTCISLSEGFLWWPETELEVLGIHTSQEQRLGSTSGNLGYKYLSSLSLG